MPTAVRRAHAAYYVRLAEEIEPLLRGSTQQAAVERVEAEGHDVRAAFRHLIAIGEVDTVADAAWRMLLYWWIRNLLPTAKSWTDRLLESGVPLTDRSRAIAITFSSWVSLVHPGHRGRPGAADRGRRALPRRRRPIRRGRRADRAGHRLRDGLDAGSRPCRGTPAPGVRTRHLAGRRDVQLPVPRPAGRHRAPARPHPPRRSRSSTTVIADGVRIGDHFVEMIELTNAGWARLALGDPSPDLFARHLELTVQLGNEEGVGHALEGLAACAIAIGDIERAGVLFGAVDTARTRTGHIDQRTYPTSEAMVEQVLASEGAAVFEAAPAARSRDVAPRRAAVRARSRAGGCRAATRRPDRRRPDRGAGRPAYPSG